MTASAKASANFPKAEEGYYHLTAAGWQRKDTAPFPADRIETWHFLSKIPSDAAKQQVHLERLWGSRDFPPQQCDQLRAHFGYPIQASHDIHLTIDCRD